MIFLRFSSGCADFSTRFAFVECALSEQTFFYPTRYWHKVPKSLHARVSTRLSCLRALTTVNDRQHTFEKQFGPASRESSGLQTEWVASFVEALPFGEVALLRVHLPKRRPTHSEPWLCTARCQVLAAPQRWPLVPVPAHLPAPVSWPRRHRRQSPRAFDMLCRRSLVASHPASARLPEWPAWPAWQV